MTEKSIGHYTIFEKPGEGGMGEVYEAADQRLRRMAAPKVLPRGASASKQDRPCFLGEAQAPGSVSIPTPAP